MGDIHFFTLFYELDTHKHANSLDLTTMKLNHDSVSPMPASDAAVKITQTLVTLEAGTLL